MATAIAPTPVGMAEMRVVKGAASFICLGLGSCIGLLLADVGAGVYGMIHIMLPEWTEGRPLDKPAKFANTGIEALLKEMTAQGANPARIVAIYAGGAQVFKLGANATNTENKLEVGSRNSEAVAQILKEKRIRVLATDVGGQSGRTVNFDTESNNYRVKTAAKGDGVLCQLR